MLLEAVIVVEKTLKVKNGEQASFGKIWKKSENLHLDVQPLNRFRLSSGLLRAEIR